MDWDLLIAAGGSFVAALLGSRWSGSCSGASGFPAVLLASGNAAAAAGTNIAVSAVTALVGGITHARAGRVDWRIVAWMAPPSVVAAFIGGLFGSSVPEGFLLGLISVVLFYSGLDLLFSLRPGPEKPGDPRTVAAVSGAVIGLIGGAVGLILGTLRMPALLKGVGLTAHKAVGTNLVVGFFLGVSGLPRPPRPARGRMGRARGLGRGRDPGRVARRAPDRTDVRGDAEARDRRRAPRHLGRDRRGGSQLAARLQ